MARINDIPVIEKVKKDDKISGSIWDKENGLYIPSSYYNLEEVNPILIKIFWGFLNEDGTYYRMFWLLPVSLILAYGSTLFISKIKTKDNKRIIKMRF